MSLKREMLGGIFYTAISKYAGMVVQLVIVSALARLLTPDDFGIVAVATVLIAFFSIFSDLGISPAIVQHKELSSEDLSSIFSFTFWSGLLISGGFFCSSWWIASYYHSPVLRTICQILSIDLFFSTLTIVPSALLYKNKRFRFIAFRTLLVQAGVGTLAVIAALTGAGLYALLITPVLSGIILFFIDYRQYPQRLHLTWGIPAIRKIFAFSFYQLLFNLINYFSRNLDKLLIGKHLGMTPLGYYEKSYRLMMLPLQYITHIISPVMHPIFSEFQHDLKFLSDAYLKVIRILALIGFPLSVFLWFTAREITLILFGQQWLASVPAFRILALTVGIQLLLSTAGSIFQAANSTRIMFFSGLFSALLNVTGMLIGIFVFGTIEAVAWSICITFSLNFLLCYTLMFRVTFRFSMLNFWRQLISPLILSGITSIVLYPLHQVLGETSLLISLLIKGIAFVILMGLYIQFTGEYDLWKKLRALWNKFPFKFKL